MALGSNKPELGKLYSKSKLRMMLAPEGKLMISHVTLIKRIKATIEKYNLEIDWEEIRHQQTVPSIITDKLFADYFGIK